MSIKKEVINHRPENQMLFIWMFLRWGYVGFPEDCIEDLIEEYHKMVCKNPDAKNVKATLKYLLEGGKDNNPILENDENFDYFLTNFGKDLLFQVFAQISNTMEVQLMLAKEKEDY